MIQKIVSLSLILSVTACKEIIPIQPEVLVDDVPVINQRESSVYLPIKINLAPYFAETEKSIPKSFNGKEDHCDGVSYSYKFVRNPIEFDGKGKYLTFEVDGKYALNLNYCPECTSLFNDKGNCIVPRIYASCGVGEPMRRVSVGYSTEFHITPDYRFKSNTDLKKFETIDPCEITVFSYDATSKLKKEVTGVLKDLEKDIDKEIGSIDIRTQLESVWKMLADPLPIGNYGFVTIQPKSLSLSEIRFDNKTAFVDLNIMVQPKVTSEKPMIKTAALPNLSEHKKSAGFDIELDIIANYDSLSSILTNELSGKSVEIKKNKVIFQSLEIHGASNHQLSLKVDFDGKKKGTLYLVGTPTFDSEKQIISFPDLVFDIKTKNALLKSAKWLFNDKVTDLIRKEASISIKPHLDDLKNTVQKEMNRELSKGVFLSGNLNHLEVDHIFPRSENLTIRVNSKGEVKLKM